MLPTPEDATSPAAGDPKPQRILACELCQRRKVRCDRQSPCNNCVKANVQCIFAAQPRQRRRRFPERELLERLRRYETLLRNNGINFDPLHPLPATVAAGTAQPSHDTPAERRDAAGPVDDVPTGQIETVNLWDAMNQKSADSQSEDDEDEDDEIVDLTKLSHDKVHAKYGEAVVKQGYEHLFESHDSILFGTVTQDIDTKALHPQSGQILRLWQFYLENVNPILKVTHAPTFQPRIIDAAVNMASVSSVLEAQMFAIYSLAILSLDDTECQALFGSPRELLLKTYQFACKQSLIKSAVLRTRDRECLTALFLYLVSYRPGTDPRALAPMLGVAVRLAQRMGLDNQFELAKCSALEAEMRRRLWWALVLIDNRICEMSHHGSTSLLPTRQCRPVLNVNDSDLLLDSKTFPEAYDRPTEAIFAVIRSEIGDFMRQSAFHLSFTNLALMPLAKDLHLDDAQRRSRVVDFEEMIEHKYLRLCNPDDRLHFMTIWSTRTLLARLHVLQHFATYAKPGYQPADEQRDSAVWHATRMIESDTQLARATHVKGFGWHVHAHFPAPAYIHILQDLRKRSIHRHARKCWDAMSENFRARFVENHPGMSPFLEILSKIILQAWDKYQVALEEHERPASVPPIVEHVKEKASERHKSAQSIKSGLEEAAAMNFNNTPMSGEGGSGMSAMPSDTSMLHSDGSDFGGFPDLAGQDALDIDLTQFDLSTMDWNPLLASNDSYP